MTASAAAPGLAPEVVAGAVHALHADPRPGLLVIGDALRRERALPTVVRAVAGARPMVTVPAHLPVTACEEQQDPVRLLTEGDGRVAGLVGPDADRLLVVPAAELLDTAVAVRLSRAGALVACAPTLEAVHPALVHRCALVWELRRAETPLADSLAGVDRLPADVEQPGQDDDAPLSAADVVRIAQAMGLADHALELAAARIAAALGRRRTLALRVLTAMVFAPRAQIAPPEEAATDPGDPPLEEGAEPPSPEDQAEARDEDGGAGREEPPEPDVADSETEPPAAGPPREEERSRRRARRLTEGRRGPVVTDPRRGHGGRVVDPQRPGVRVALMPTVTAAAPWQPHRGVQPGERLAIRPEDLRGRLYRRAGGRLMILVVDASGSMAERTIRRAKGLALSLLDAAYRERLRVGIVVAKGRQAVVGLAPTRSLSRARSCMRALPTGGGTPMASALLLAGELAARHDPEAVDVLVLTDGRANVGVAGDPREDALRAMRELRGRSARIEVVDLAPRWSAGDAQWLADACFPKPTVR